MLSRAIWALFSSILIIRWDYTQKSWSIFRGGAPTKSVTALGAVFIISTIEHFFCTVPSADKRQTCKIHCNCCRFYGIKVSDIGFSISSCNVCVLVHVYSVEPLGLSRQWPLCKRVILSLGFLILKSFADNSAPLQNGQYPLNKEVKILH